MDILDLLKAVAQAEPCPEPESPSPKPKGLRALTSSMLAERIKNEENVIETYKFLNNVIGNKMREDDPEFMKLVDKEQSLYEELVKTMKQRLQLLEGTP